MTDKERIEKLSQAEKLIREVEFSYPENSYERSIIYHSVAHAFSIIGYPNIGMILQNLKDRRWK